MSLHALSPRFLLAAGLLAACTGALAAQQVGRVLLAAGDTFAVRDGQTVRLEFNSPIEFKDVLRTGPASSLQVRFVDEGLLSIRENSEFAIEDYQFGQGEDEQRSFFRLIKGGFRAVTGLIGRTNHAAYRVRSETATIGIRGTDYAVRECRGDCGADVKDGLYGSVLGLSNGTNQVTLSNNSGESVFGVNQNFYVPDANTRPLPLLQPPSFVSVKPQGKASAAQQGGSGTGGEQAGSNTGVEGESRPSGTPTIAGFTPLYTQPYQVTQNLDPTGNPAVLPPANGFVAVYGLPPDLPWGDIVFDHDQIVGTFNGQNQLLSYGAMGAFPSGSLAGGSIADTGSLTLPNGQSFTWGRWTGNTQVTISSGETLTGLPVLFGTATGLQQANNFVDKVGGVAAYAYAGGPKPVDTAGNVGSITSSSLTIDFTHLSASYSLGMSFPSVFLGGVNTGSALFDVSGTGLRPSSFSSMSSFISIPIPDSTGRGEFVGVLSGRCSGSGCLSSVVLGPFGVGLTGTQGYEFAVVPGIVFGTQAGDVAFLNAYNASTFTPGPAPIPVGPLASVLAYSNQSPPAFLPALELGPGFATYNAANQLTAFNDPFFLVNGSLGTGTIVEAGSATLGDGGTVNWGRWSGGQVMDPSAGLITPASGVPFVVGIPATNVPTSGSFLYSFAGGPNPVDAAGHVGSWGGGSFQVNFGSTQSLSTVTPLSFTVNSNQYSLSGSWSVAGPSSVMSGPLSGTCGGNCSSIASGGATAILVGPNAGGLAVAGSVAAGPPTVVFAGAFKR